MSLFDSKSEATVLRNRTNSAPESCYGLKRKWDQISSDQNPMLNERKVGEGLFQRAKVEERFMSLFIKRCAVTKICCVRLTTRQVKNCLGPVSFDANDSSASRTYLVLSL